MDAMAIALDEARLAAAREEVPVGAVVVGADGVMLVQVVEPGLYL